ncbi:hypothetical protein AWH62_12950 [Maricaulis sp. W15]|uniref:DoxX family protein n=1 Tax=Maricaulis sp. W15 TaxID=1772333 RepID=UPI0009489D9B|nr:DoxX family protein [Maricaulis sp. W15]OLF71469.1 hypothetical protein AWH62_12950 [Maricaulis sp. W15]
MNERTSAGNTQSRSLVWGGWALSGLLIAFLLFDAAIKLMALPVVGETLEAMGYAPGLARGLGVLTLTGVVLYAVPRTSVLGAIILTGLFGGAMASHLRIDSPLFSHTLFGLYLGLLAWGGLFLRNPRLRALLLVDR